jgi:type IV pilus assembly protein PilM
MALFGLGRKPTTFGLDIGTSAIKVVELAQSKGGLALKSFATVPLPRDVIAEGTIREPQVVTDAIRECVEKAGITGTNAVISVSGREAIVKRVPLPKVTAKELGDAIQLEAEHHIPFAIDDVFLDYQVVSQSANAMSVVLVATKKVKVLEYVAAV